MEITALLEATIVNIENRIRFYVIILVLKVRKKLIHLTKYVFLIVTDILWD